MDKKNYKQIAREILDNNDMEPMNIKVDPKHLARIEGAAEKLDLTVPEAATFLLYSYVNDLELYAKQAELQNLNPN